MPFFGDFSCLLRRSICVFPNHAPAFLHPVEPTSAVRYLRKNTPLAFLQRRRQKNTPLMFRDNFSLRCCFRPWESTIFRSCAAIFFDADRRSCAHPFQIARTGSRFLQCAFRLSVYFRRHSLKTDRAFPLNTPFCVVMAKGFLHMHSRHTAESRCAEDPAGERG